MINTSTPAAYDARWLAIQLGEIKKELDDCLRRGQRVYTGEGDTNQLCIVSPGGEKFLVGATDAGQIQVKGTEDAAKHEAWPVGSVYTNKTDSRNPAEIFGYGTWEAIEGRVVVGYKSGDSDFGTAGATLGEKSHTLTVTETPSHVHEVFGINLGIAIVPPNVAQPDGNWYAFEDKYMDQPYHASTPAGSNSSLWAGYTGGGQAHNNIQPSIVCYVWVRTA